MATCWSQQPHCDDDALSGGGDSWGASRWAVSRRFEATTEEALSQLVTRDVSTQRRRC